jgi:transcription elongation GreA/GreB family factor
MNNITIEDLFINAAEDASAENLEKLLEALKKVEDPGSNEIGDELELIFGELEENMTEEQACFCMGLARLNVKDHSIFRKVLNDAIKKILPPYLNKLGFLRALGLRDRDVPLSEITFRYDTMLKLKNSMQVFFKSTKRWGIVSDIDTVSASVAVNGVNGGAFAVPLSTTLSEAKIFESSAPAGKLAKVAKNGGISGADYCALAKAKCLTHLDDETIKEIAYATVVPETMNGDEFKLWWTTSGNDTEQKSKGRQFFEARSLHEMHVLLGKNDPEVKLDDESTEKLVAFFERLNPAAAARDVKVMAESISLLVPHGNDEQLKKIFEHLIDKAPFWPEDLESIHLDTLNIWGTIPAKHVVNIAYAMSLVFSDEYLAAYTTCLPLRCLNTFGEIIDDDLLYDAIRSLQMCSCDILLWIWRNRKKHDKELLQLLSIEQVAKGLSDDDLPKAWTGAQRDLKVQLMDKEDFQKHLLELVGDDIWVFTSILQTANFCSGSERQSLLIKLSRLSPALRKHLEGGAGQRALGEQVTKDATPKVEPLYTSIKSHKGLLMELSELVKTHIPENRESLKVARAHGDFRENAEYDAAKERRNFLNRRRDELERDILLVQPMDFEKIKVEEYSVVGSAVTIKLDSGKEEQYFLAGAWDGNPDENIISYKTRMGKVMMHHKADDEITLPNGSKCTISKVEELPKSIIKKLRD